jgi:hypothetical protein
VDALRLRREFQRSCAPRRRDPATDPVHAAASPHPLGLPLSGHADGRGRRRFFPDSLPPRRKFMTPDGVKNRGCREEQSIGPGSPELLERQARGGLGSRRPGGARSCCRRSTSPPGHLAPAASPDTTRPPLTRRSPSCHSLSWGTARRTEIPCLPVSSAPRGADPQATVLAPWGSGHRFGTVRWSGGQVAVRPIPRFTAEITALNEALTMLESIPTPHRTWSSTAHST